MIVFYCLAKLARLRAGSRREALPQKDSEINLITLNVYFLPALSITYCNRSQESPPPQSKSPWELIITQVAAYKTHLTSYGV